MARYDNIDTNGKDAFKNKTPSYEDIMKQKAKDTKKALHKQKKEEDMEAAGKAMDEEVAKEYEAQKELEKTALENNGQTVESRDRNKDIQEGNETAIAIEDAKVGAKKPVENNGIEQIASEAKIEDEIPPEVEKMMDDTDEAKYIKESVETKDPSKIQNVVDPDGNPVMKGVYGKDSVYKPHTYTIEESRLVKNPGMAACLTLISKAISAFGLMAGIPIPPINFMKFGSTPEEDLAKLNENEQNYAKILNAGMEEANETIRGEGAKNEAYQNTAAQANENPDLYNPETQNKVAGSRAAIEGTNTQLDQIDKSQEFEKWKTEYSGDLQKAMQKIQNDFQLDLTDKLYRQQVQAIVDKIAYMKQSGFSNDDIAKAIQSMEGVTTLQRGMGYAKDTVGMVSELGGTVGSILRGGAGMKNATTNRAAESRRGFPGATWPGMPGY